MHNYFQRDKYEKKIPEIWEKMSEKNLTCHAYDELVNSNLFKYSPYTTPTEEQNEVCYNVMKQILDTLKNGKSGTSVVYGSAGTGKTIVAINLVYTLTNILLMNVDDDIDESDKWQKLIKDWKTYVRAKGLPKIAFVVPMQSLNATLSDVFNEIGGSKMSKLVTTPYDVAKDLFDIVIVDESHRLKRRKGIMEYGSFDNCCRKLGMDPAKSNQLDWIVKCSKCRVLFYDPSQSIKSADVMPEDYMKSLGRDERTCHYLHSQMRCLGGNDYIEYVKEIFDKGDIEKKSFGSYDIKLFDDVEEMVQMIKRKNDEVGLCRAVAGYAWEWVTKGISLEEINEQELFDIDIEGNRYIWNTTDKDWILSSNSVNEIGCVHTIQGYDLNYVGIIFGREIEWNVLNDEFDVNLDFFFDKKVKEATPPEKVKEYIINAYKVMMTRGIKGCYMYACNPGMQKFLKKWF